MLKDESGYSDPETYRIPRDRWSPCAARYARSFRCPDEGTARLTQREAELETLLERVNPLLNRDSEVRREDGDLIVTPLEAEERPRHGEPARRAPLQGE